MDSVKRIVHSHKTSILELCCSLPAFVVANLISIHHDFFFILFLAANYVGNVVNEDILVACKKPRTVNLEANDVVVPASILLKVFLFPM